MQIFPVVGERLAMADAARPREMVRRSNMCARRGHRVGYRIIRVCTQSTHQMMYASLIVNHASRVYVQGTGANV